MIVLFGRKMKERGRMRTEREKGGVGAGGEGKKRR